jgi:hypothetical protein
MQLLTETRVKLNLLKKTEFARPKQLAKRDPNANKIWVARTSAGPKQRGTKNFREGNN